MTPPGEEVVDDFIYGSGGCWRVVGRVGDARLTFVRVRKLRGTH